MDEMDTNTIPEYIRFSDIEQALREIESMSAHVGGLPIININAPSDMPQPELPVDGNTSRFVFRGWDSLTRSRASETIESTPEFVRRVFNYGLGTVGSTASPSYSVTRNPDYSFYLFDEEDNIPKHTVRVFSDNEKISPFSEDTLHEFCYPK